MPWRCPTDLARFKRITTGHPIIMGRATHEAIGKVLPDRTNIILSNTLQPTDQLVIVPTPKAALEAAEATGAKQAYIIGGGQTYRAFLPKAHRILLTRIHLLTTGDTHLFEIDPVTWDRAAEESYHEDPQPHTNLLFTRRPGARCST